MFNPVRVCVAGLTSLVCLLAAAAASAGEDRGALQPVTLSKAGNVRQEDRRADRRQDAVAQGQVSLPRSTDGSVDAAALEASIAGSIAAGVREIQVRSAALTQQEAVDLFLSVDAGQNLLRQIGDLLPSGSGEWAVSFRGTVDARVQRQPDGSLRLRVEGVSVAGLSDVQRADLARQLSEQTGFARVRIEGLDADGRRVRTEFRSDRGLVQNVVQGSGNLARGADDGRRGADDAGDVRREDRQGDRAAEAGDDRGLTERSGRGGDDRVGRSGSADRPDRADRPPRPERPERPERPDNDRSGRGR